MIAAVTPTQALAPAPATASPAGGDGAFGAMLAMLAPVPPVAADAAGTIAPPPPVEAVAVPPAQFATPAPSADAAPEAEDAPSADDTDTTGDEGETTDSVQPPRPEPALAMAMAMPAVPVDSPPATSSGEEAARRTDAVLLEGAAHGAIAWRAATAAPVGRVAPSVTDAMAGQRTADRPDDPATAAAPASPEASAMANARPASDAPIAPDGQRIPVQLPRGATDPIGLPGDTALSASAAATLAVAADVPVAATPRTAPDAASAAPAGRTEPASASRDTAMWSRADRPQRTGAQDSPAAMAMRPAASPSETVATVPAPAASSDGASVATPAGPPAAAAFVPAAPAATVIAPAVPAAMLAGAFAGRGEAGVAPSAPVMPSPVTPGPRAVATTADEIVAMTGLDLDALFPADRDAPLTVSHIRAEAVAGDAAFAAALAPAAPAPATGDAGGVAMAAAPAEAGIQHHLDVAHDGAWLDRLARDIALSADRDSHMRFQLNPERLGALIVDITGGADGASVRFTADTDAARALIADAQPRLVAEARAQGARIADARVDVSGGNAGGQQGGAANPFAQAQGQSGQSGQPGQQQPGGHRAPRMSRAAPVAAAPARAERYA